MIKFFILQNNEFFINKPEILIYKEFENLWKKDRTKNKTEAIRLFKFIYFYSDINSIFVIEGYSGKKLETLAAKEAGLDINTFKIDAVLEAAIEKYKELCNTASTILLTNLLESLNNTNEIVTLMNDINKKRLTKLRNVFNSTVDIDKDNIMTEIDKSIEQINKLQAVANSLPKTVETVLNLQAKVLLEASDKKIKAGGKQVVRDRETPEYSAKLHSTDNGNDGTNKLLDNSLSQASDLTLTFD